MLGPIDYITVAFKGNNFNGSILEALTNAAKSGAIRVVDLIFVIKDKDGTVTMAEIEDQHEELREVAQATGHTGALPLLSESDVEKVGSEMDNNTSAAVLIVEQLWAKDLKKALIDTGAELLDEGRIHPDKVSEAMKELETATA